MKGRPGRPSRPSRRSILKTGPGALLATSPVVGGLLAYGVPPARAATGARAGAATGGAPWPEADRIVRETRRPRIPHRTVDVRRFGAVGDGTTDCTRAFRDAIDACAAHGGGHVVVPPGRYPTGPIRLRSRVDLHVQQGATIAFSTDPAAYLPAVLTRDGGIECMNFSPFLYAYGQHDISVTGGGTLDGQADNAHWWPWSGKAAFGWEPGDPTGDADGALLADMAERGVPVQERVFGQGHYLRPQFFQPYRCQNVLISGVTLTNTPNWQMNPVLCTNVTVQGVTAHSLGPNNDGCDPESCDHVVIDGCTFTTGDDCIAVKAGKNADGRRVDVPCQDIVIQDCTFTTGHGGVTIGSEMTGGVRRLYARDLRMESIDLNDCLRLKTNSARGGFIEDVYLRDTEVQHLNNAAVEIDFSYGEGPGHGFNPLVRDIHLARVSVAQTHYPILAKGYADDHITRLTLDDCRFDTATADSVIQYVDEVSFHDVYVNGAPVTPLR